MIKLPSTTAVALAAALTMAAGPASADNHRTDRASPATSVQRQIDQVLRHGAPGGRQTSPNQVSWARDGVTLTLFRPDEAHAARFSDCPVRYVCLWQDANGTGRRVQFFRYRTYRLSAYGMPAGKRRDATSYANAQTGGAAAYLRGRGFKYWLFEFGNLPRTMNDKAVTITLVK
jgi:hypothetical protein